MRRKILFAIFVPSVTQKEESQDFLQMCYMGPLTETRQADFEIFWYGPWLSENWIDINWALFEKCMTYRPDVLMMISGWHPDYQHKLGKWYPRLVTFYLIRKLLHIRISALWTDQQRENFINSDHLTRFCDIAFTHEHPQLYKAYTAFSEKYIYTSTVYSPVLFHHDAHAKRNKEIVFIGGIVGHRDGRAEGIDALKKNGLNITIPGHRFNNRLSNEEYAACIKDAKIVINWCRHVSGKWFQAKGRIFESTLAGAMLLCEACDPVNHWLQPYVDYVPFDTNEDLVRKAKYYLEHEDERLKIAAQGNKTALLKYNAEVVWAERLRLLLGPSLYKDDEAIEGLKINSSRKEWLTALFFMKRLSKYPNLKSDEKFIIENI